MSRSLAWILAQNDYRLKMIIGCKIWLTVRTLFIALTVIKTWYYPASNYMSKVNNRNNRTRFEICSKLTIKTPERRQIYDPFKYLWWNVFAKLSIRGFNPLIVSGMFQPLLACYGLLRVVSFLTSNDFTECFDEQIYYESTSCRFYYKGLQVPL